LYCRFLTVWAKNPLLYQGVGGGIQLGVRVQLLDSSAHQAADRYLTENALQRMTVGQVIAGVSGVGS
jgi:hypothetical protein